MGNIFGFLNVDKPAGITSHDVVDVVRRGLKIRRVGHAGTLDPMATGVLVICLEAATRLSEYVMGHPKLYQATVSLGQTTTTYDAEGEIVAQNPAPVTREEFLAVLPDFRGAILQIPPMYSAIKQGGEKLYEKARRGEEVERPPREVTIYELQLEAFEYPEAVIRVCCSPGTYIRSLAHDIGQMLGVGAHLTALRRTAVGDFFTIENSVPLDTLQAAMADGTWQAYLLDVSAGLAPMPMMELNADQASVVRNGGSIPLKLHIDEAVQAWCGGKLIGILGQRGAHDGVTIWKPEKVFNY